jgi:hypothetical protein
VHTLPRRILKGKVAIHSRGSRQCCNSQPQIRCQICSEELRFSQEVRMRAATRVLDRNVVRTQRASSCRRQRRRTMVRRSPGRRRQDKRGTQRGPAAAGVREGIRQDEAQAGGKRTRRAEGRGRRQHQGAMLSDDRTLGTPARIGTRGDGMYRWQRRWS